MDNRKEEVLDAIHRMIRIHNYRLTEEEIEKADREILPFLEEKILPEIEPTRVHSPKGSIVYPPKLINPVTIRYYAISQDNLELLNDLLAREFPFENYGKSIPFFIFEKMLTSQFSKEEYISVLEKYPFSVKRFMDSLLGCVGEERAQNIKDFAYVVKRNPSLLEVGRHHVDDDNVVYNILTKHNLDLFGKDFFLKINSHQKNIINMMFGHMDRSDAEKMKELFQKYPSFSPTLPFHVELLHFFTVDELGKMSPKDESIYLAALRTNMIPRMKEILALDPSFDCPAKFVREEVLRVLDNETILQLTDQGKYDISNISVPESDKVVFFPVKKIQLILLQDKIRRKKQEKTAHK